MNFIICFIININFVQTVLDESEFLPTCIRLLGHEDQAIRIEICWILSNITAGNIRHIERIITFPSLIENILRIITTDILDV